MVGNYGRYSSYTSKFLCSLLIIINCKGARPSAKSHSLICWRLQHFRLVFSINWPKICISSMESSAFWSHILIHTLLNLYVAYGESHSFHKLELGTLGGIALGYTTQGCLTVHYCLYYNYNSAFWVKPL